MTNQGTRRESLHNRNRSTDDSWQEEVSSQRRDTHVPNGINGSRDLERNHNGEQNGVHEEDRSNQAGLSAESPIRSKSRSQSQASKQENFMCYDPANGKEHVDHPTAHVSQSTDQDGKPSAALHQLEQITQSDSSEKDERQPKVNPRNGDKQDTNTLHKKVEGSSPRRTSVLPDPRENGPELEGMSPRHRGGLYNTAPAGGPSLAPDALDPQRRPMKGTLSF